MYLMLKKNDLHMADAITRIQLLSYKVFNSLRKDSHSSGLIARKRHTKRDDSVIHYHPFIAGKVYILTSRLSTN